PTPHSSCPGSRTGRGPLAVDLDDDLHPLGLEELATLLGVTLTELAPAIVPKTSQLPLAIDDTDMPAFMPLTRADRDIDERIECIAEPGLERNFEPVGRRTHQLPVRLEPATTDLGIVRYLLNVGLGPKQLQPR